MYAWKIKKTDRAVKSFSVNGKAKTQKSAEYSPSFLFIHYIRQSSNQFMEYTEISPSTEISPFVKCFWEYENKDNDIQHTIFPNGYFELFTVFEQGKLISVFLSGLRTKPFDVHIPKGITVSAIRFMLSASEYIFNREIGSVLDTILPLTTDFWNFKKIESLSFRERTLTMDRELAVLIRGKEISPEKLSLLNTVYIPDLSVKAVADLTQWSSRRINRYFNRQFGIPLKTFLSIIRLRSSFESVKNGNLYPELNYYDQSHYIKEVKKFTGESPKKLLKNENDRFLQFSVKKKP